ncbi:MAG: CAP domain-containing protein [Candidatus Altiarchaeota archaeon]|nr:CAP domain-containing protein [Candidatus Altiarchaeota archaeon]
MSEKDVTGWDYNDLPFEVDEPPVKVKKRKPDLSYFWIFNILICALILIYIGVTDDVTPEAKSPSVATILVPESIENNLFNLINVERNLSGVHSLTRDSKLDYLARSHSIDMGNRDFFSHVSPDGAGIEDRADYIGFTCNLSTLKENIIVVDISDFPSEKIVERWVDNGGDYVNILDSNAVSSGVGIFISKDKIYATQVFC